MVRVLLVDESAAVRDQVHAALMTRGGFKIVGEAASGHDAAALVEAVRPDVAIIDLGLPDLAGREVITRMRRASPATKVVVFSAASSQDRAWAEREAEAFVLKEAAVEYLVSLVASVTTPRTRAPALHLPDDPSRLGEVRRFVRRQLADWDQEDLVDDACLVVTELAANAISHARTAYQVAVSLGATSVRIEVGDAGEGQPEPRPPSDSGEGGRGLLIVSSVSASWGIDESAGGKVVWADLLRQH